MATVGVPSRCFPADEPLYRQEAAPKANDSQEMLRSLLGIRLGKRTRFGNGTRFACGWLRRFTWRSSRLRTRLFPGSLQTETQRTGGYCHPEPNAQSSSLLQT